MKVATRKVSPSSKTRWDGSHVNMLYNVVSMALSITYIAVTQSISALYTLINSIQGNLATVETLRNITRTPITGYAAQKKAVRVAMEGLSVSIMNAAYSYAAASNNPVLAGQMKNAASTLSRMTYRECLETVQAAILNVAPFVTDGLLTPYNVTPAMMSVWASLATQLSELMSNPQNAIAIRTATNANIQMLLLECMVMLTNSGDTMVTQLKDTNITYYTAYWSSRRLHQHPISTQLRIYVVNQLSQPVNEGEVIIVGTDRSALLDLSGYALVEHIPFGVHNVTLTTTYGTDNYGPFDFKKGKVLTLHVQVGATPSEMPTVKVSESNLAQLTSAK